MMTIMGATSENHPRYLIDTNCLSHPTTTIIGRAIPCQLLFGND